MISLPSAPTEEQEQEWLIAWTCLAKNQYPDLRLLFHIPNGGLRHPITANKLKRAGVKPGVPDLFLPVARKGFHGLFIEMKRGTNSPKRKNPDDSIGKLSPSQLWWRDELRAMGFQVKICYGFDEGKSALEEYLS